MEKPKPRTMADVDPGLRRFMADCVASMLVGANMPFSVPRHKPFSGIVNKIEREDGSGLRFNLKLADGRKFFINWG